MKNTFSKLIVILITGTLIAPAHLFAQPQASLSGDPEKTFSTGLAKIEFVSTQMIQKGSLLMLTPSAKKEDAVSPKEISAYIRAGTLPLFYALTPEDPSIHQKLGMKIQILPNLNREKGIAVQIEALRVSKDRLVSFEKSIKKLIQIDFNQSNAVSATLSINEAANALYHLAVHQISDSVGKVDRIQSKVTSMAFSLFLPSANAELISDFFVNLIYLGVLAVGLTSVSVTLGYFILAKMGRVKALTWKQNFLLLGIFALSAVAVAFICSLQNQNTYGNDGR